MLSPLSLFVGFLLGMIAAGIAVQLGLAPQRKVVTEATTVWDLSTVAAEPRVVAEEIRVRPPAGAKLLVPPGARLPEEVVAACEVRTHPGVQENAALGNGHALVFTTHVRPGALAIATRDPSVVMRLEHEWSRLWKEGEPWAPMVQLTEVPKLVGHVVEVRGFEAGMTEYRGRNVLRIESEGHALPVLVEQDPGLAGQPVRVVGKVVTDHGMTYVKAERIAPVGRVAQTPLHIQA